MGERVNLLGVNVNAVDLSSTVELIGEQIISGTKPAYICLAPAHNLMACRADLELRKVFNRSLLTVPDGMGTVVFLRALGHKAGRVYGPDLMQKAADGGTEKGWKHFFLGGNPGIGERVGKRLSTENKDMQIVGYFSPPFRKMDENEVQQMVTAVNAAKPDIVWVALGSPKQEYWMAEFRDRLRTHVLIGVGAAFDFLAGAKPQAPKWMQHAGLEWFFRLISEPRRLWRRYAQYPLFVVLAFAQIVGLTRYEETEQA
jgi:N-acetylglucosaminyldiphosphoundecaprenol N-acetyl-beta-D-mannosaminyltransferase